MITITFDIKAYNLPNSKLYIPVAVYRSSMWEANYALVFWLPGFLPHEKKDVALNAGFAAFDPLDTNVLRARWREFSRQDERDRRIIQEILTAN